MMSVHYNTLFQADPINFVRTYTVDIKTWFQSIQQNKTFKGYDTRYNEMLLDASNVSKYCRIDLEPFGGFLGFNVHTVQFRMIPNQGIDAYWLPYIHGNESIGYSDIKKEDPPVNFVFTSGMNGCAFIVTESPLGPAYMRVYHNQHPGNHRTTNLIRQMGQSILSSADFNDYGDAVPEGHIPIAFNFLYYTGSRWIYVFQPQSYPASISTPPRQTGRVTWRNVINQD